MVRAVLLVCVILNEAACACIAQRNDSTAYKFTADILQHLNKDTNEWRFQTASYSFVFTGQYRQSLLYWDKDQEPTPGLSKADSIAFLQRYQLLDARSFILQKARESQVLIFNEAHANPRNRVFVKSLLKDLKGMGYNWFCAETFFNDSSFFSMHHPVFETGYYTMEPSFGNLVREAMQRGLQLFPYESPTIEQPKEREINQAKNLAALLQKHPGEKIIVYCGFDHLREDSLPFWERAMAGRLKEYTGIDPYTIDQVALTERSQPGFENKYYRVIRSPNYSVLVDKDQKTFHTEGTDLSVYTPLTSYIYNRPAWLFENGRRSYFISARDITISYPILVKVFYTGEQVSKTIPTDIIEISSPVDLIETALSLPVAGKYLLVITNKVGQRQELWATEKP